MVNVLVETKKGGKYALMALLGGGYLIVLALQNCSNIDCTTILRSFELGSH